MQTEVDKGKEGVKTTYFWSPLFSLVHSVPHLFLFFIFPIFLFSFALPFASFAHPFPFYQNSPTPFPGRRL